MNNTLAPSRPGKPTNRPADFPGQDDIASFFPTQQLLALKGQILGVVLLFLGACSVQASTFVHPEMSHKRSDLDRMKAMVKARINPWYSTYQLMTKDGKASFNYTV